MNLKQLKYVLALSSAGSFSKAADDLNISQPSLSQYIRNIEKELGMDLFVRANGYVRLTDAGKVYLKYGKKILSLEHQLENELSDISGGSSGTITIGISPYRSFHMIPQVAREFNRLHPGIELIIKEKSGSDLIESALHGEFDICVIALPVYEKSFNVEVIQKEEIVIAVNKSSDFYSVLDSSSKPVHGKNYPAVDIRLTEGRDFAMLNPNLIMRSETDKMLARYGISINEKIEVSSNEALISVVSSGMCAAFVSSGLTGTPSGDTAFYSIEQEVATRDIAIIYRKDQYVSKAFEDLCEIFKTL